MALVALILALVAALASHGATDVRPITSATSPDVGVEFLAPACSTWDTAGFIVLDGQTLTVWCGSTGDDIRLGA